MVNNGEWFVTSEHGLATMKHARLPSAVWDPRQEALKQSFHPPLMVVYVKDCIVSLLPCQAHDRQTQPRSRRSIPAGQPARATDFDPTTEWRPTLHGTAENGRWDHHVHVRAARRPLLGSQPPSSNAVGCQTADCRLQTAWDSECQTVWTFRIPSMGVLLGL